jgi:hypothetical protein
LEAYETDWRAEPVDGPGKWRDDLGAKVDSRIQEEAEVASNAEASHGVEPDTVSLLTAPQPTTPGPTTP